MLEMRDWATLLLNHTAIGRSGGPATNVQMATHTTGQQESMIGAAARVVLSAVATECANTTR